MPAASDTPQHPKFAITAMAVEGFGRFQEPTRIEFAPVTFLIGPNGAGKSTVGRVLEVLRRALQNLNTAPREPEEANFRVWFEFAFPIAPMGWQLGIDVAIKNSPQIIGIQLGTQEESGISFVGLRRQTKLNHHDLSERSTREFSAPFCYIKGKDYKGTPEIIVDHDKGWRTANIGSIFPDTITNLKDAERWGGSAIQTELAKVLWDSLAAKSENLLLDNYALDIATSSANIYTDLSPELVTPSTYSQLSSLFKVDDFVSNFQVNEENLRQEVLAYTDDEDTRKALLIALQNIYANDHHGQISRISITQEYLYSASILFQYASYLLDTIEEFCNSMNRTSPFRLAQKTETEWFGEVPSVESERLVSFAHSEPLGNLDGTSRKSPFSNAPYKAVFLNTFHKHFNVVDIQVSRKLDTFTQLEGLTSNDDIVPIRDFGTGFKALLSTYAWVLGFFRSEASPGAWKTPPPNISSFTDYPINLHSLVPCEMQIAVIEELETNLHPSLQTKLMQILVGHALGVKVLDSDESVQFSGIIPLSNNSEGEAVEYALVEEGNDLPDPNLRDPISAEKSEGLSQSLLGRMYGPCLIFETHSEYMIRSALAMVARGDYDPDIFAINYLHAPGTQPEGEPPAYRINIRSNGTLDREFGPGFFDEAQRLKLELIELNRVQANQAN